MPHAVNGGVRIHYEMEGEGSPLLLHAGSGMSAGDWRDFGHVAAFRQRHRLILMDPRGHGDSDKPHDPALHAPEIRVGDALAVLDALGIAKAHYYGHSYGGVFGYHLGIHAPHRFCSLILSGGHPYAANTQGLRDHFGPTMEAFLATSDAYYGKWMTPTVRARLAKNDLASVVAAAGDRADLSARLPDFGLPCLMIAGDTDPIYPLVQRAAGEIPGARFLALSGCGHVDTYGRIDLVVPEVLRFLAEVDARL